MRYKQKRFTGMVVALGALIVFMLLLVIYLS